MQRSTRKLQRISQLLVLIVIVLALVPQSWAYAESDNLIIRYLDVNPEYMDERSGDLILITTPDGQNILIDSLVPEFGPHIVTRLRELGIEKLDYAIASHPHIDHIGGFLTILNEIEVEHFFQINVPYTTSSIYRDLQTVLSQRNIPFSYLEEGDLFQIGELEFEVLNPPKGTSGETIPSAEVLRNARILNDLSLVMRLDYKDFSILFTGDIYIPREMELVVNFEDKLNVDILDMPHHGETTSNSSMFIGAASPKYAMMSNDGIYSITTIDKYSSYGIEVFITGSNGEITIVTDGYEIDITTEREHSPQLKAIMM